MGYASLQNQINRATKIKNVMIALTAAFGDEEFTRKQAEAILRGSGVSFDAIVKHNGAFKSREETFTVTIYNDYDSDDDTPYYVCMTMTGLVTNEFSQESEAKLWVCKHGGMYEKVIPSEGEKIDAKRFYYVLTPARLKLFNSDDLEHEKALAIAKLNKKIAELNTQIALLESL